MSRIERGFADGRGNFRVSSESASGVTDRDEETEEVPSGLLGEALGAAWVWKVSHLSGAYVR
jgi:hypothetical protein